MAALPRRLPLLQQQLILLLLAMLLATGVSVAPPVTGGGAVATETTSTAAAAATSDSTEAKLSAYLLGGLDRAPLTPVQLSPASQLRSAIIDFDPPRRRSPAASKLAPTAAILETTTTTATSLTATAASAASAAPAVQPVDSVWLWWSGLALVVLSLTGSVVACWWWPPASFLVGRSRGDRRLPPDLARSKQIQQEGTAGFFSDHLRYFGGKQAAGDTHRRGRADDGLDDEDDFAFDDNLESGSECDRLLTSGSDVDTGLPHVSYQPSYHQETVFDRL